MDSRILASETGIVELGSALHQVDNWLGFRDVVFQHPGLIDLIKRRGEDCFDIAWCHYSVNNGNMTEHQLWPPKNVRYNTHAPTPLDPAAKGKGCVVIYQTPIIHSDKHSLPKDKAFKSVGHDMCRFMKHTFHVHYAVKTVYDSWQYNPKALFCPICQKEEE
mmetsp:Transcript_20421/g.35091  ORF Transcript_20421/g.35091 Transcript_20421/m.35091 type:complete len:162 (-) Transcript_20421:266-751(-)